MKMADELPASAIVQFASDTTSGAIAGVAVDNSGSDMGKMAPMSEALRDITASGRASAWLIGALSEAGRHQGVGGKSRREAYVRCRRQRTRRADPHAPQQADAPAIADWREHEQAEEICQSAGGHRDAPMPRPAITGCGNSW